MITAHITKYLRTSFREIFFFNRIVTKTTGIKAILLFFVNKHKPNSTKHVYRSFCFPSFHHLNKNAKKSIPTKRNIVSFETLVARKTIPGSTANTETNTHFFQRLFLSLNSICASHTDINKTRMDKIKEKILKLAITVISVPNIFAGKKKNEASQ